jgi:hypothetical protein
VSLSKSRYCKAIQCPKILWLDEHKSEARDDTVLNQTVLDTGSRVGDLAMGYYGEYTEVPYSEDKSLMLAETSRLLEAKTPVICEASFSYEGNFCSVDILRVFNNGVEIIEVKSSTSIAPIYYHDMAFQYYVLASCGLNVQKISLMHINNQYERQGKLDLNRFFTLNDCTDTIRSMQKEIAANIGLFKQAAAGEDEPKKEIGEHCFDPYECVYRSYCWRHIPQNSVFDISGHGLRFDRKLALYQKGVVTFEQLLASGEELNSLARLQVETQVHSKPPIIDKKAIRAFLDTLTWPLYFLDFESFQEAVPPYNGLRPYMQIPFQYSLHIQQEKGGPLEHKEFLVMSGIDPRRALAERLCNDIPQNACVLAYNMGFEKGRIKELAAYLNRQADEIRSATPSGFTPVAVSGGYDKGTIKDLPSLSSDVAAHLMNIHDHIQDLMQPFQSRAYYSKELCGSYSSKKVLPALCPNDSELDYHSLELVHNGTDAQAAYAELSGKSPDEQQSIKTALLAYCRLDTLAMVKILEKLQELCR